MKYVLDSKQMKQVDNLTINKLGIPSVVLMERAALSVVELIENKVSKKSKVISVCGKGNNGADGIAAARILFEKGYDVTILMIGTGTDECELQLSIAKKSGIKIKKYTRNKVKLDEYNLIIDALFGIGLSRNVEGSYLDLITAMNNSKAKVVSVDIPSGINATTGQLMAIAVKADYTVTFGYKKIGLMLYPGADYSGKIKIADIGFPNVVIKKISKKAFTYTNEDIDLIPKKKKNSNKGMYGKVLVIAGSELMGGAACLAAHSAYRSGTGIVKVLTHENNRNAVLKVVPEAIISTYNSNYSFEQLETLISSELEWSSCVIIGPGLSKSKIAVKMTEYVLSKTKVPTIIDADALNIMADMIQKNDDQVFTSDQGAAFILTPHIGEMERISGFDKAIIKSDPIRYAEKFVVNFITAYVNNLKVICVMKDARTIVSDSNGSIYINSSGNSGMAKGGSGDVLTGVIAGLISNNMPLYEAACMGAYIHGLAGDMSAVKKGEYGMKAGDIIDNICTVMK